MTAEDLDGDPNGPPLEFTLLDEGVGVKWRLQQTGGEQRLEVDSVGIQCETAQYCTNLHS